MNCHYRITKWPLRSETIADHKNASHPALGDKSKIYLQPLHIKFGLLKMSVRAMDRESERFAYLRQTFPKISKVKMKEGIFFGPQMTKLFEDPDFSTN